jgi:hypothetical protein
MADVEESIRVAAPPAAAYQAVAGLRRMARWSPECVGVWVLRRRPDGGPRSFVGFNRRGPFVWFTTCRVVTAEPHREFAFDVSTFGLPVARWGYRFVPDGGGTTITEYWVDRRSPGAVRLARIFTGPSYRVRLRVNRRHEGDAGALRAELSRARLT